jgi:hypothetical protein
MFRAKQAQQTDIVDIRQEGNTEKFADMRVFQDYTHLFRDTQFLIEVRELKKVYDAKNTLSLHQTYQQLQRFITYLKKYGISRSSLYPVILHIACSGYPDKNEIMDFFNRQFVLLNRIDRFMTDEGAEAQHPIEKIRLYHDLKQTLAANIQADSDKGHKITETELAHFLHHLSTEFHLERLLNTRIFQKSEHNKKLIQAFEAFLLSLKNIEANACEVLFHIDQLDHILESIYADETGHKIHRDTRLMIIEYLAECYQVSLTDTQYEKVVSLNEALLSYPRYAFEQKSTSHELRCHDRLLSHIAYQQGGYAEYHHLTGYLDTLIEHMPVRKTLKSVSALSTSEKKHRLENQGIASCRNFLNIKLGLTQWQYEESLIDWSLFCIKNLCQYFIAYDVKENLFHDQHRQAEYLLFTLIEKLFERKMPVIDRFSNIIHALQTMPLSEGYLKTLTQACLAPVKSLIPLIASQHSAEYQALQKIQTASLKSDEDIEGMIEQTPLSIIQAERTRYKKMLLRSSETIKNLEENIESHRSIFQEYTHFNEDEYDEIKIAAKPIILDYLIEKENRVILFLRWFSHCLSKKNSVDKAILQSGRFRVSKQPFQAKTLSKTSTIFQRIPSTRREDDEEILPLRLSIR